MPRATVLTHVAFEDLGTLAPVLAEAAFEIEVMEASVADLKAVDPLACDLLVVLGGPIGVYEAERYPFVADEIALLRARLAARRPTLGICLGAQLMAAALGAAVVPGASGKELGWSRLQTGPGAHRHPAFQTFLDAQVHVLHWHGDTFDLPAEADWLAATGPYPHQAFAIGQHALALQFHPEVGAQGLERWYVGHACELVHAGIDVPALRAQSLECAPKLEQAATTLWRAWIGGAMAAG